MESLIREGALRLLTAEASCDVILSCQGHRLMAHKLILSMASPVFRKLLLEDCSDPTVVILPDINGSIMSLILDYIYTGSVIVYSNTIQEFFAVAGLLKIHLDIEYPEEALLPINSKIFHKTTDSEKCKFDEDMVKKKEEIPYQEKAECLEVVSSSNPEVYSKKNQRKLPNLLPINAAQNQEKNKSRKLCSYILPSPWCPRIERIFGDPRTECIESHESQMSPTLRKTKIEENDSNNNFQLQPIHTVPSYFFSNKFNDNVGNRYLNTTDKVKNLRENNTPIKRLSFESYTPKELTNRNKSVYVEESITEEIIPKISAPPNNFQTQEMLSKNNKNKHFTDRDESSVSDNFTNETIKDNNSSNSSSNDGEDDTLFEEGKAVLKSQKQKPFKCEDCGKTFSQLRNYKYHRSVHEGTKEFAAECPECGKVFNDRGYLSSHMKIHRDKKEYACPHCPKRFNQRVAYNMHLRIHTGVKPHECSICGKSFSRKMLLKQHQRVHTGERPYSCPECGKTFADRSNMSLHARLHTGVKPYACNLCSKSFTKKHHLKTHMNFHTGLKPYSCEKCGLAFSQSSNMRTHYKKCILKSNTGANISDEKNDNL